MNKQDKIILAIITLVLVLASAGLTYAFFTSFSSSESASTIAAKGGNMSIKYASGNGNIVVENIYPREAAWVNKSFTVTGNNTTDLDMYYSISLVIDNAEKNINPITYTLNGVNTSNNGSIIPSITTPEHFSDNTTELELGVGKFNKGNNLTHSYVLNIYFKDDGTDQNYGQEMNFSAHLIINNENDSGEASYTGSGRNILTHRQTSVPLTKTFNVDSGNIAVPYDYDIYLINNSNSNYSPDDFTYTLKGTDKSSSGTVANITNQALSHDSSSVKLGSGTFTKKNATHKYSLSISGVSLTNTSLNYSPMPLNTIIQIDGQLMIVKKNTLSDTIMASASGSGSPKTVPGKVSATTNEGINKTADDYGTSYYYRGSANNNYVQFANMCWRIVRVTGNGAIKLVLQNNNSTDCTASSNQDQFLKLKSENTPLKLKKDFSGSADTVALMYKRGGIIKSPLAYNDNFTLLSNKINSDDTIAANEPSGLQESNYSEIFANTTKSNLLNKLEAWYSEKLSNYTDYLEDVIWCNDKSYNTSTKKFGAYTRFNSYTPSLVCPNDSLGGNLSKYTVSDTTKGNGALTYKIGLLTADELMFAGASSSTNTSFYLYVNSNDEWWTISPANYNDSYYISFTYKDKIYSLDNPYPSAYLRPTIAIKSTAIVGGTGTKTNPYVILAV